ncbi:MAG: DHA2 family efflux MFS transporter permease subunit [Chloroflexota bacterium]
MALDTTIVNVAIVPISKALASDVGTAQWIFSGYLLANAAVVTLSGYLGNRFGVKRLFVVGIALFTTCSALCGLAPSEGWLIACRVLQGSGGGVLMPLGMAIALQPFAENERAKATALIGVSVLLAPVFGPIVGGLLIDNLAWQSIFFVNVPIGLLGVVLALALLPPDQVARREAHARFDYLGLILCTVGVVALVYGFKLVGQTDPSTRSALQPQGTIYGWGYWPVWAFAGAGLVLLVAFGLHALRSADPVVDLRLFTRPDFGMSNLVLWVSVVVTFGVLFLIPVYLEQVRLPHLSALETGVALLPLGIATLAGVILGGGLYRKVGARPLVFAGGLLSAVSSWQLTGLTPVTATGDLWPWLFLLGLSMMLIAVPVQTLALAALSGPALNTATSLVNSAKLLVGTLGSAVLVTLFVQQTTSHGDDLRAASLRNLPAAATSHLTGAHEAAARTHLAAQAGTAGLADVFTLLIYGSVVLMVLALALPGRRGDPAATEEGAARAGARDAHVA